MIRLVNLLAAALFYACAATVLAQGIGVAYLWHSGLLERSRIIAGLSALYGLDRKPEAQREQEAREREQDAPSLDQLAQARLSRQLDLDLREQALSKAITELRNLQLGVRVERERFDQQYESFKAELDRVQQNMADAAIGEVQRTLEAIEPRQAKDQLLRMLDDPELEPEERLNRVTAIVKLMVIEKRKKVLAEFKTKEEGDKLAAILKQLGEGAPEVGVMENARRRLNEFENRRER